MGVAIKDDGRFVRERLDGRSRPGRVDVEASLALWSHEGGWTRGVLRNLSIGGMFVITPRSLPIGARVVVRLSSVEGGEPDEIEARVSWLRRAGTDRSPAGVGLAFIGPMVRAAIFVRVVLRSRLPRW
jgi:Tfp pilus assembly protein PilZ